MDAVATDLFGDAIVTSRGDFGEAVMFRPLETGGPTLKFEDRWHLGVWFGSCLRTGDNIVGVADGVCRGMAIRREPADERWPQQFVINMLGTPGGPVPGGGRKLTVYRGHLPPRVVQYQPMSDGAYLSRISS